MLSSTQPFFTSGFLQKLLDSAGAAAAETLRAIFNTTIAALLPYWPLGILILFILFVVAAIKFVFGRWGMMGSLIYHVTYFGVLGIIVAIWGVEILLNPYFDLVYAVLYPVSYLLTGLILRKLRGEW